MPHAAFYLLVLSIVLFTIGLQLGYRVAPPTSDLLLAGAILLFGLSAFVGAWAARPW